MKNPRSSAKWTYDELMEFYEVGARALEKLDDNPEVHRICQAVCDCQTDFHVTLVATLTKDFCDKHPERNADIMTAIITEAVAQAVTQPMVEDIEHAAGHYYLCLGIGIAIMTEVR